MKSFNEFVDNIQTKAAARRKRSVLFKSIVSVACAGVLIFLVAFSNIVHIDFYANSYLNYLLPYVSANEEVGVKLIDENNAVVMMDGEAHACVLDAKSSKKFELTPVDKSSSQARSIVSLPAVFRLEFWDNSARIRWELNGVKIEEVLSITEEKGVHAGVWVDFATQNGDDAEVNTDRVGGKLWTVIEENGDAYTGEGYQVGVSKFISIGDKTFNASFDPASGLLTEISTFEYTESAFDFPTLKQAFMSDGGEPYYFYFRRLTEEEKVDFSGGEFTAKGVIRSITSSQIPKSYLPYEGMARWRLGEVAPEEGTLLKAKASLDLKEDGSARLLVKNGGSLNGNTDGKWYALNNYLLVVLDEKSNMCGRAFIVYPDQEEANIGESYRKWARSTYDSYDVYKTGYREFNYHLLYKTYEVFWGKDFDVNDYLPKPFELFVDVPYVLEGTYSKEYYEDKRVPSKDEALPWEDIPWNGRMSITFLSKDLTREEERKLGTNYSNIKISGKAKIVYPTGEEELVSFRIKFYNYNDFASVYLGKRIALYRSDNCLVRALAIEYKIDAHGIYIADDYFDCVFKPAN